MRVFFCARVWNIFAVGLSVGSDEAASFREPDQSGAVGKKLGGVHCLQTALFAEQIRAFICHFL